MTKPIGLVVEDERGLAEIFASALEDVGFQVETLHDGQAALDFLAINKPSLIILDLHLPYVSGERVLSFIREQENLAETPVFIVSADDRLALHEQQVKEKATLVLLKPIRYSQLRVLAQRFVTR